MTRRWLVGLTAVATCAGGAVAATSPAAAAPGAAARSHPHVLLVGKYHGIAGKYRTIQAAVNAAHRGDVILVGPGDYKTRRSRTPHGGPPAGVLITTPRIT